MSPRKLAKALRDRQSRTGLNPNKILRETPDAEIVAAYTTCARCRESIFADPDAAVRTSVNVEEFIHLVSMALAAHQCQKTPVQGLN